MKKNFHILLIIVSLLPRLALFIGAAPWKSDIDPRIIYQADARHLHNLAVGLLERGEFSDGSNSKPNAYRTPLFPLLIAFTYSLVGYKVWVVILIQIVLDALVAAFLFSVLRLFFQPAVSFFSAMIYALDPAAIYYSNILMSDTFFTFLCAAGLYTMARVLTASSAKDLTTFTILAGMMFGLAALTRAFAVYIPIIVVAILILRLKSMNMYFRYSAVFLLMFFITISPWLVRNYITFRQVAFSNMSDNSLLVLYVTPMESIRRGLSLEETRKQLFAEADSIMVVDGKDPKLMDGFQRGKYWRQVSVRYIRENPMGFIRLYVNGVINCFVNVGTEGYAHLLGWKPIDSKNKLFNEIGITAKIQKFFEVKSVPEIVFGIAAGLFLAGTYILMTIGIAYAYRRTDRVVFLFALLMMIFFVGSAGVAGLSRFRIPAVPYYSLFIGLAIHTLHQKLGEKELLPAGSEESGTAVE